MSDTKIFGPMAPPSTWPLDNVPIPIVDGIAEQFQRYDEAEDQESRSQPAAKKEQPYFGFFPDRPRIKVLGPHSSRLSLVSKSFRQATTRGIFTWVDLKTSRSVHLIKTQLGAGARSQVTHLNIRRDTKDRKILDKSIKETADFISSLPKLEAIYDDSRAFLHKRMPLPKNMRFIGITLKDGNSVPESLDVRSVFSVRISPPVEALKESKDNLEVTFWHSKVSALIRKFKEVTMLSLRLPGLPTCGCSHQDSPIPEHHHLRSPLEDISFIIPLLHLYLPFCSAIPGHQREDQWWAYLGWLTDSKAKVGQLSLTMAWNMTHLRGPSASGLTIQESLGLGNIDLEREIAKTGKLPSAQDDTCPVDEATKAFCLRLLARHPELKRIFLHTVGDIPHEEPINLRTVVVEVTSAGLHIYQELNPAILLFVHRALNTISAGYMPTLPHRWTARDMFLHLTAHPPDAEDLLHSAAVLSGNSLVPPFAGSINSGAHQS